MFPSSFFPALSATDEYKKRYMLIMQKNEQ